MNTEAIEFRNAFFEKYPDLIPHESIVDSVALKLEREYNGPINEFTGQHPAWDVALKLLESGYYGGGYEAVMKAYAKAAREEIGRQQQDSKLSEIKNNKDAGSGEQSESNPPIQMSPRKSGDLNADPLFKKKVAEAEKGNADAQAHLGYCYYQGEGVPKNMGEAVKWWHQAAVQGNAVAQCNLGMCFENGNGVRKDKVEAMKWYCRAAEQGNASAQYSLGTCYSDCEAMPKYRKPVDGMFRPVDEIADWGLSMLGMVNVTKDAVEAVKWFRKAAEQGDAEAQNKLGCCYEDGRGVTKDLTEAVKWYRKAAEQGNAFGQNNLGFCYNAGRVVSRNFVEAHKWHSLASAQGVAQSKVQLFWLERFMTGEQIVEAQRLASRFKPRKAPEAGASASATEVIDSNPAGSATGFFITEDGFSVTNEHVVRDASQICIVTNTGIFPAKVVKLDKHNDLALLKASGRFAPLPIVSSRTAKLGGTVATVGFPNIGLQGFAPKLAKGEIASLAGVQDDARYFQISLAVQPGNSGGALVDARGNVVGIVAAKLDASAALAATGSLPENVNYAVKSSLLLSFLESVPDVAAKLKEPNVKDESFEEVVKSAQDAAVLVLVY
jgi:TPR repeat protein